MRGGKENKDVGYGRGRLTSTEGVVRLIGEEGRGGGGGEMGVGCYMRGGKEDKDVGWERKGKD